MRDRLITSSSFQHGLTTLGFQLSEEVRSLTFIGLNMQAEHFRAPFALQIV